MREIIFRGQRLNGTEWIQGDFNLIESNVYIFDRGENAPLNSPDWYEVKPETVGQYTGMNDKNGNKIFEGDIVSLDSWVGTQQIRFIEGAFCLCNKEGIYVGDIHYVQHGGTNQCTVIGNVTDNPDLLTPSK